MVQLVGHTVQRLWMVWLVGHTVQRLWMVQPVGQYGPASHMVIWSRGSEWSG